MTSTSDYVVTLPDPDGSLIRKFPCVMASSVGLYALSQTGGATLTVRLFSFTVEGNLISISPSFTFISSAIADFGNKFSGTPNSAVWLGISGAGLIGIKVDALTGGPWTIGVNVFTP